SASSRRVRRRVMVSLANAGDPRCAVLCRSRYAMTTRDHSAYTILVPAAIVLGCAALAARPPATVGTVLVVVAVGTIGAVAPLPARESIRPGLLPLPAVVALGVLTFLVARIAARPLPAPLVPFTVAATITAAVAEELFFRRLVYAWLVPAGEALA